MIEPWQLMVAGVLMAMLGAASATVWLIVTVVRRLHGRRPDVYDAADFGPYDWDGE